MAASLLGTPVTVAKLDYRDPACGLVARCDGPRGSGEVGVADLPGDPRPDWTWPN
jgi:hypothetical protein